MIWDCYFNSLLLSFSTKGKFKMPRKSKIPCSQRGCPNLIDPNTGGYCEKHKTERHKHYYRSRGDKKETAFYKTARWKSVRRSVLFRDMGLCVICKEPAVLVDHIIEVKDGGAKYDPSNLQSLCFKCHSLKTKKVERERRSS